MQKVLIYQHGEVIDDFQVKDWLQNEDVIGYIRDGGLGVVVTLEDDSIIFDNRKTERDCSP